MEGEGFAARVRKKIFSSNCTNFSKLPALLADKTVVQPYCYEDATYDVALSFFACRYPLIPSRLDRFKIIGMP